MSPDDGTAPGRRPGRQGAALLELVEVMDRLRSPGGCPWDAEQTHASLAPYAVEEAYELAEAIASGSVEDIADELGDVLLQVVFHARVGEDGDPSFDIDDVADGIMAKLKRRHPHVFAGTAVSGAAEVETNWDAIKAAEKPHRRGPLDGIPHGMPPLERATKVVARLERAGRLPENPPGGRTPARSTPTGDAPAASGEPGTVGDRMLALVIEARRSGLDVSAELRAALSRLETSVGG